MLYVSLFWHPKKHSEGWFLKRYAKNNKKVFFIQIGANDGFENDLLLKFIFKYNWKGILVEPQYWVFEKLKQLHQLTRGLIFENAAIVRNDGKTTFYKLSFSESPWATGLSALRRESLEEKIASGFVDEQASIEGVKTPENKTDYIKETQVTGVSLATLIARHEVEKVNVLQISACEFDCEIVKMIDTATLHPDIIIFPLPQSNDLSHEDCLSFLKGIGYLLVQGKKNILAVKEGTFEAPLMEGAKFL